MKIKTSIYLFSASGTAGKCPGTEQIPAIRYWRKRLRKCRTLVSSSVSGWLMMHEVDMHGKDLFNVFSVVGKSGHFMLAPQFALAPKPF